MKTSILSILFLSSVICASNNQPTAKSTLLSHFAHINDLYALILGYLDKYDQPVDPNTPAEKYYNGHSKVDALSPDGRYIASRAFSRIKLIIDPEKHMVIGKTPNLLIPRNIDLDKQDMYTIKILDTKTLELVALLEHSEKKVYRRRIKCREGWSSSDANVIDEIAYSPNGKYIASCAQNGTVKIWDAKKYTLVETYEPKDQYNEPVPVNTSAFSRDGKYLMFGYLNFGVIHFTMLKNQAVEIEEEARLSETDSVQSKKKLIIES